MNRHEAKKVSGALLLAAETGPHASRYRALGIARLVLKRSGLWDDLAWRHRYDRLENEVSRG